MSFDALEVSLQLVESIEPIVVQLKRRDANLADQIDRAVASVPTNLAEGRKRTGGDRLHLWRIAEGSADEVRTALRIAKARKKLDSADIAQSLELLDRILAMCWRLTHR